MPPLTSRERAHLRAQAHHLKPTVHIGKEGVTDAVVQAVEEAFHRRELLKVKVLDAAFLSPREAGLDLASRIEGVQLVQTLGRIATLYRPHPDRPGAE
ncbi:MAG: YhbY family RNA-binding protein [Bacteroidetes bacterium]|nr:hypothetical protein AWN76_012935 [Rhodothermaceae bacterium RA]RMH52048.1 MAG: YhbY family RNA-binding protein [Bacteroidota bacterium]